jgi:hypothetical protein
MGYDRDPPRAVVVLRFGRGGAVTLGTVDRSVPCDLGLLEDLLRLQLAARRLGWAVEIVVVCPDLRQLFDLVGMTGQLE